MFEGSLVESRGLAGTGTERWTALGSLTVQCAVAGLLVAIPLLRPEVLPIPRIAPPVALPFPHKPPMPVMTKTAVASSAAMNMPAAAATQTAATRPLVFTHAGVTADGAPPMLPLGPGMGSARDGVSGIGDTVGIGTVPVVIVARPRETGLLKVSTGISEGLLLAPIRPMYPAIAKAVRMQGTVVIEAVISKAGRVESVHAVSGPQMLQQAAKDAVAAARYRPYLLNGEPTEVKTTYTVVFSLGG
jgi:protein TonB